jgi:sulfhydrogenase subunit delta
MQNKETINDFIPKKKLAIFSLTSCEGCQFEMLSCYEDFEKILKFYDVVNFRLGQEINLPGPFDVSIVEGNPDGEKQEKLLKEIRKHTKLVIAIGACAHLGGIQSERNHQPKKLIDKEKTKTVADVIRVEYIIPGCPINRFELYDCLMDVYWGKIFRLPDLAVCFECRQNENPCLLKQKKLCLGPITRAGCDSVCVNSGEACLGCRGTIPNPNIKKLKQILGANFSEKEIDNFMTIYGTSKDLEANLQ